MQGKQARTPSCSSVIGHAIPTANAPIPRAEDYACAPNTQLSEPVADGYSIVIGNTLLVILVRGGERLRDRLLVKDEI